MSEYVVDNNETKSNGRTVGQASHSGGPVSSPGQVMWDFWWQSGAELKFLRALRLPLPILIPLTAPYSSIIRGWYNRPVLVEVPSGLSLTPPQKTKEKTGSVVFWDVVSAEVIPDDGSS
jgi:hypothetical protein